MPRLPISQAALRRLFRGGPDRKSLDEVRRDPHMARDLGMTPLPPQPSQKPELW